jgi:RNA polymerase sigma-70 factor (ECF subfamily)
MTLDEAIDAAWRAGNEAWPAVRLERAAFAGWVAGRAIAPDALLARGADLYLVAGCVAENGAALAAFERHILGPLPATVGRVALSPDQADELRQQLRCTLLLPPRPRIGNFRGEGPLAAWVRVCAVRTALSLVARREGQGSVHGDALTLEHLVSPDTDQEVAAIKAQYRDAFQAALEECFRTLPLRHKTLLRMHFLDEMTIDAIGIVFHVHRATVARWLVAIRGEVLEQICRKVSLDLRATSSEFTHLVRLIRSDVQLSIRRILGGTEGGR